MAEFDPIEHEAKVSEHYARLARYEAFDRLVDDAIDGKCTVPEAIKVFKEEELPDVQT